MLNDVFFRRYQDVVVADRFDNNLRTLFAQAALIIIKQLYPSLDWQGKENQQSAASLDKVEAKLCMEMGVPILGARWHTYETQWNGKPYQNTTKVTIFTIISNFLQEPFQENYSPDKYAKFKISLIELAFRQKEEEVRALEADLPRRILEAKRNSVGQGSRIRIPGNPEDGVKAHVESHRISLQNNVDELNTRFRQAGLKYQYHNGFIQGSDDTKLGEQIEKPFWDMLTAEQWKNVDTDMKEALDRRDTGNRDPAFYAARALESTIKIISDQKGFTTGSEKGAAQYIQNLVSAKNGRFIEVWESDALITFFSRVRNPLGHGPGSEEMPKLSQQQNDWAIESCMSWIKSLIRRM